MVRKPFVFGNPFLFDCFSEVVFSGYGTNFVTPNYLLERPRFIIPSILIFTTYWGSGSFNEGIFIAALRILQS